MSADRVSSVSPGSTVNAPRGPSSTDCPPKASQGLLERRQIEAQAGVRMLENGAKLINGFGVSATGSVGNSTSGSGDDFAPRPGSPPPPAATVTPPPASVPQPGLEVGGAPGFPADAVKTPGGYVIVPTGDDAAWEIYGPGQKPGETPLTRVWGDPHVNEKDGTRWDFTKDSNFMLPDGTVIRADTTSETGKSFTQGLSIIAGNDRVEITGINSNNPRTSAATKDGEAWMNQNAAVLQQGATFAMRSDGSNVDWFRATNGKLEGVITGSRENFDGKGSYDQIIGGNGQATGNQVEINDAIRRFGGQAAGGLGFLGADVESFIAQAGAALASMVEAEDLRATFSNNLRNNRAPVRRS